MAKRGTTRSTEGIEELRQAMAKFQAELEELAEEVKLIAPDAFDEFARFRDSVARHDQSAKAFDTILAILPPDPERR